MSILRDMVKATFVTLVLLTSLLIAGGLPALGVEYLEEVTGELGFISSVLYLIGSLFFGYIIGWLDYRFMNYMYPLE